MQQVFDVPAATAYRGCHDLAWLHSETQERIGHAIDRHTPHARILHDTTVADVGLEDLELRLHQHHERSVGGAELNERRHQPGQRHERQVGDDESGAERQVVR